MTAYGLLKAVSTFLRDTMAGYAAAQGKQKQFRVPEVYEWYLPLQNSEQPDEIDFPYIVPRIVKGEEMADYKGQYHHDADSAIHIAISFGIYHEGTEVDGVTPYDGAYDLLNVMEHVRISLLRQPMVARKYELQKPYTWHIPDEQPYPLWVGQANTIWMMPNIYEETGAKTLYDV